MNEEFIIASRIDDGSYHALHKRGEIRKFQSESDAESFLLEQWGSQERYEHFRTLYIVVRIK